MISSFVVTCDQVQDSINCDDDLRKFWFSDSSDSLSENKCTYAVFNNMAAVLKDGPIKTAGIDGHWTLRTESEGSRYRSS